MDDGKQGRAGSRRRASSRSGGLLRDGVGPVVVAVVAALVVAGAVDFVNGREDGGSGKKATAKQVAKRADRSAPRYLVAIRRPGDAVTIRDVRTGTGVGLDVAAPSGNRFHQVASAGDGAYVVSAFASGQVTFYRLKLASDGRPQSLSPVPGLAVRGVPANRSDMAVNGGRIAYVTSRGIEVASANGAERRKWTTRSKGRISSLSWAGDTLSFVWTTSPNGTARRQVRTLNATAASGDLAISKGLLALPTGGVAAVLTRSGSTVVAGVSSDKELSLVEYSAQTGQRIKVLWTRSSLGQLSGLTRDAKGTHVLAVSAGELVFADPGDGVRELTAEDYADVAW